MIKQRVVFIIFKHFHRFIFSDSVVKNEIRARKNVVSFSRFLSLSDFQTAQAPHSGAWPPHPNLRPPRERSRRLDEARRRSLPPTLGAQLGHTAGRSGGFLSRDSLKFGRRSGCRLLAKQQDQLTARLPRDIIDGRRE